jgi:hypothetical protein
VRTDPTRRPGRRHLINNYLSAKHTTVQNEENTIFSGGVSYNWPGAGGSPSAILASATFEEQRLPDTAPDHRHALFFGFRRGFRSTDDLILPRRGYFGNVTAGYAPAELATQSFARFTGAATLLFRSAATTTCCCAPKAGWWWRPRARASRLRSCSAPAATRPSAATPSRVWA